MNINLTAIIKSKPGHAETMKGLLARLVAGSTKEAACLQYDLHQDTENENIFIFHEIWEGAEGLSLHEQQPHIKEFGQNAAEIMDGPVVIYQTKKLS